MPPKTLGRSGLSTNPPSPARHFSAALEDFGFKTPETGQDAAGNEKPTSRQVLRNRFPGGAERSRSDYERGFSKCPRGSTGRDSWSTIHAAGASRKSAPGRGNKADVVFRGEMTGPRPAQAPRASGTCVGSLCKQTTGHTLVCVRASGGHGAPSPPPSLRFLATHHPCLGASATLHQGTRQSRKNLGTPMVSEADGLKCPDAGPPCWPVCQPTRTVCWLAPGIGTRDWSLGAPLRTCDAFGRSVHRPEALVIGS